MIKKTNKKNSDYSENSSLKEQLLLSIRFLIQMSLQTNHNTNTGLVKTLIQRPPDQNMEYDESITGGKTTFFINCTSLIV